MTRSEEILSTLQGRFGTQDPSQLQIQKWEYYDYVRYPVTGTTQLAFFTNPLGSNIGGVTKTLEQTNMTRNAMFDYPFIITEIKTQIYLLPKARQAAAVSANTSLITGGGATAAYGSPNGVYNALWNLSGQGVLNVQFGQKTYFDIEQPFRFCPTGFGVDIINGTGFGAANVINSAIFQQSENPDDIYKVTPPVLVEKDQNLQIAINFPNGTSTAIPQISATDVLVDIGLIFSGFAILPTQ